MTQSSLKNTQASGSLQEMATAELLRNRIVIRRAEELARLGYFIFDSDSNKTTYLSPGLIKIASSLEGNGGEVSYENLLARIHKDDLKRVEIATRSSIQEGYPLDVEFRTLTGDGEIMHLWMTDDSIDDPETGNPIRLGIVQDITERRIGEERHRKQAALRGAITRNAIDCIVAFDEKGQILEFNPAAEERFDLQVHQAVGKSYVRTLFHPRHWETLQRGIDDYLYTECHSALTPRLEVEGLGSDGNLFPIEVTITPVSVNGRKYFSALMRDLTERKAHEKSLRDARDEAQESNQAKTSFLAGMSHELRTPLNGTLGALDALEDTELSAEQQSLIGLAKNSGDTLLSLINTVLDLSRIEARQVDLQFSVFDVRELIESSMEISSCQARNKNIILSVESANLSSSRYLSDSTRIGQILRNLISNAVHNTIEGEITVRVREKSDPLEDERKWLVFEVEDTGSGVPKAIQESLFVEFVTRTPDATTTEKRVGLGLAISKTLVEALSGQIGFESTEGEGSTFWFSVPVAQACRNEDVPLRFGELSNEGNLIRKMQGRILLAEDSPTNAKVVKSVLERRGVEIDHVNNGEAAIKAVQAKSYDLVLMDVSMPIMDGLTAMRTIRGMVPPICDIPIIALTARAIHGDREMCCDAGADDYVSKPYRKEDLITLVADTLEQSAESRATSPDFKECVPSLFSVESLEHVWQDTPQSEIRKIVDIYIKETKSREKQIGKLLSIPQLSDLEIEYHALKSSSRNVGLTLLGAQAEELEIAAAQDDERKVRELHKELEATIALSIATLIEHFQT